MRRLDGSCSVYLLRDPNNRDIFYVGVSKYPRARVYEHVHEICSPVRAKLRALFSDGFTVDDILEIHSACKDRREAFDIEHNLIIDVPGLLNADKGKRKYPIAQDVSCENHG